MSLAAGVRLGPYEILSPLGAGGMGEIYRARDPKLQRDVAIKVLPDALAADPSSLARFEREARAVAALSHPNILAIHDFGTNDGAAFAVMELLAGETLRQRLDHGALPQKRAVEIGREMAAGLAAAHAKGIVHRDLKPENVFLTRDGLVKILDFGLARQFRKQEGRPEPTLTEKSGSGVALGTAGYMSPEQVRGETADHRADIFAFGAVLYEMLSGRRAFPGATGVERMNAILHEEPAPLSSNARSVSPALERVVGHCLEKRPDDRFQSASDLVFDLASFQDPTSSSAALAIPPTRRRVRRAIAVATVLAASALLFWAGTRVGSGPAQAADPAFHRLTFRRGYVVSARFAPDGKTVVYSAAWEGRPAELFSVRTDSLESRPLGIERAEVRSVSSKGDLAVLLGDPNDPAPKMLARIPLGGGSPRELLEGVVAASWAPNGEDLAVIRRRPDGWSWLEYPVGQVLLGSQNLMAFVAVSPDGNEVAVVESNDNKPPHTYFAVDRRGRKRMLERSGSGSVQGFAWSPASVDFLFIGGPTVAEAGLRAVNRAGRTRLLIPSPGGLVLHDVGPGGSLLLERVATRVRLAVRSAGETSERELSWLDGSDVRDISADGRTVLFGEVGEARRASGSGVYLRGTDASPAIRLGDGFAQNLSADGKWAVALVGDPPEVVLLPTGPGVPRKVATSGIRPFNAHALPDNERIAVLYLDEKGRLAWAVVRVDGGPPQRIQLPGYEPSFGVASSPDGSSGVYARGDGRLMVTPLSGEVPHPLPGPPLSPGEQVRQWSNDGRYLYIARRQGLSETITRREIASGQTSPWLEIGPAEPTGVTEKRAVALSRDGGSYAYTYWRVESSDLFVVEGLK